jgi:hypothetical protein
MRLWCIYIVLLLVAASTGFTQTGAAVAPQSEASVSPPPSKPGPQLSDTELELFLKTAPLKSHKILETGTTRSIRATLSDGKLTHDVHVQCIDIYKPVWKGREGGVEKNFRDSWKFNVAGYRLAKMLGLDMVPMSVERDFEGKPCSYTWWLDDIWVTEAERRDKGIKPPTSDFWTDQLNIIRVYDQLIYNTDRNQGNLLITPEWKVWMIDHTRAFRAESKLLKPDMLKRCDARLLTAIRNLNTLSLKQQLGPWLRPEEISALLNRRALIVAHYEKEIREHGEDSVLTGIARKTPQVSVP